MLQTNLREFQKIAIFAALNLYFDVKWDFHPLDCSLVGRYLQHRSKRKIFGEVGKGQENQEGCSGDHEGCVTSQGLTPLP